jgi:hypothetical protein
MLPMLQSALGELLGQLQMSDFFRDAPKKPGACGLHAVVEAVRRVMRMAAAHFALL